MGWSNEMITEMGIISNRVYNDDYEDGILGAINYFQKGAKLQANDTIYTVIDYTDTSSDMQALLLESGGQYVIAFRGTASVIDILTDAVIGFENINQQYNDAVAFVNEALKMPGVEGHLTLTGHSLGGILAQQVGAAKSIEGYAYNPYEVNRLFTHTH